jgi:hypothetical protein
MCLVYTRHVAGLSGHLVTKMTGGDTGRRLNVVCEGLEMRTWGSVGRRPTSTKVEVEIG